MTLPPTTTSASDGCRRHGGHTPRSHAGPAALLVAISFPTAVFAQEALPSPADRSQTVDAATVPESSRSSESAEETIEIIDTAPPGARAEVSREVLEQYEYDDLHKVLRGVAGVYLRDEDGYGLRPNIGMRGVAADRSAKITIMEDGVLSGPAPYTAPAAYYVPLATRMSSIEITKGPSAIRFGPATVGGAVNMVSEPMPTERSGYVDLAGGSDLYGKFHARVAERQPQWAVMAEVAKLHSDGFKRLDGGGDTGFDKNDAQLSGRWMSDPTAARYHQLDLRVGFANEVSNETYVGLADADFAVSPQRRYGATRLDQMKWRHWRLRASHRLEFGAHTRLETTVYRNRLTRAWGKIDGFVGRRDLHAVLAEPMASANQAYYQLLTGQLDSANPEEQLVYGTNDRNFTSQGVQTALSLEREWGPISHHLDAGLRIHFDRANRRRDEDTYDTVAGELVRSTRPSAMVLDSRSETLALAAYVEDKAIYGAFEFAGGARVEVINFRVGDYLADTVSEDTYAAVIPGVGASYHITPEASVFAGVHRGFVPAAPSAGANATPESSINYEVGLRWAGQRLRADVIGFFSDYANLKGACTLAAGCTEQQEGEEFSGGAVRTYGAEVQLTGDVPLLGSDRLAAPVSAAYTLTRSQFETSFDSEFVGWGRVTRGDELPYLPRHQLSVSAGLRAPRWDVSVTGRYQGEARDVAGQGQIDSSSRLSPMTTVDVAAHARLHAVAELYATCSNLFDTQVIVARRPYGARPNPPRMIAVGYKARF